MTSISSTPTKTTKTTKTAKMDNSIAEKVLKRAELTRITRTLKSRLQLASFKAKRGWQDLNIESIEPKLERENKKKTKKPSSAKIPDTMNKPKRAGLAEPPVLRPPVIKSSPLPPKRAFHDAFPDSYITLTPNTVIKQQRTTLNSEPQPPSYYHQQQEVTSSPPQTPPPKRGKHSDRQEGADLLMYLATSPSPAQAKRTPVLSNSSPIQQYNLPSSPFYTNNEANGLASKKDNEPSTPKTPKNKIIKPSALQPSSSSGNRLFATPSGFNLNDYLITSPSPSTNTNTRPVPSSSRLLFPTTPEKKIQLPPPNLSSPRATAGINRRLNF